MGADRAGYINHFLEILDGADDRIEVRHLEVFHTLSRRHQPARVLHCDHSRSFPVLTELAALCHGNIFLFFTGAIGLCIEVLVVAITGVPYSGTQTVEDLDAAMFLSLCIFGLQWLWFLWCWCGGGVGVA